MLQHDGAQTFNGGGERGRESADAAAQHDQIGLGRKCSGWQALEA
jgi:hypothetical protein